MSAPMDSCKQEGSPMGPHTIAVSPNDPANTPSHIPTPAIDDRPSGRTKRKRTSPEDQATLEAAYARDPKPDKAKRLELVKLVALGEKEVQIWYQNRRQTSRRKSRPLLPHEIAQYQLSRSGPGNTDVDSDPTDLDQRNDEGQPRASEEVGTYGTRQDDRLPLAVENEADDRDHIVDRQLPQASPDSSPAVHVVNVPEATSTQTTALVSDLTSSQTEVQSSQERGASIGYFANRRSAAEASASESSDSKQDSFLSFGVETGVARSVGQAIGAPKGSLARIHLSMSSEGKAIVTTKDGTSPSPPRPSQGVRPPTAASQGSGSAEKAMPPMKDLRSLRRSASGRSRDSRAWEFWCDKDSRTELEGKAEKETSGSASEAIGLLRSTSGRSILGPLTNKRTPLLFRDTSETKKQRLDPSKRAPLRRASTSFGRLQTKSSHRKQARPSLKYSESAVSVYIPGNDSDKENWSPERNSSSAQDTDPSLAKKRHKLDSTVTRVDVRKPLRLDGHADPEDDAELANFMRGGRKSVSSEDDLDCVQGLLSLSQGNWR